MGIGATVSRVVLTSLKIAFGILILLGLIAGWFVLRNLYYDVWDSWKVRRAGFVERQVEINESTVNYAEGPNNGPPLVLIHGQGTSWRSYQRVLPALARDFHVFAVDVYGHGGSDNVPEKYTANALAEDVRLFIEQVIGQPVVVSGHSSGGLIAAVLAAKAPAWVRGVVLEDPPFFSSVLPRAQKTWNYVDLTTVAHNFLASGEEDFQLYYIQHTPFWDFFLEAKEWMQNQAIRYRKAHPDRPLRLYFMPPVFNELFTSMDQYDPRFAEAFYDNSFHKDFDHAETLQSIRVPSVLIHANWSYDENGILMAAMDGDDAERARSLLQDVEFYKVDSGHGFHFEKPKEFVRIIRDFQERLASEGA